MLYTGDLELVPALPRAEVVQRLRQQLGRASSLRAAIAYWTLDSALLEPDLARCLRSGFLCVDIHYPTSIDHLASLARAGANVFLHLFHLVGHTESVGVVGLPPHLMHAKVLLFDRSDGAGQVWTGSHNWSQRSLFGVNVEASLVAATRSGDSLHSQMVAFLDEVRARCAPFDLESVDYYKWLQGEDDTVNVIELEDRTGGLAVGDKITLFGTLMKDHQDLSRVGREVVVSITSASGDEVFYRSKVANSGEMRSQAGQGVNFDARRYAFRRGQQLPVLEPLAPIPPVVMRQAKYFATLDLVVRLPQDTKAFAPPEKQRWVEDPELAPVVELPRREWSGRRGDKRPRIQRAITVQEFREALPSRRLVDRRAQERRALVTKLILVVPGEGEGGPSKRL